jgi:putative holliday junction resolvase
LRILGVDLGGVRTGLALSDPAGIICRPLDIIVSRDEEEVLAAVLAAAAREDVGEIVVGIPRPLAGGRNAQSDRTEEFVRALAGRTTLLVSTWDERFTSKLAEAGRRGPGPADAVAACYLLQNYLDSRA